MEPRLKSYVFNPYRLEFLAEYTSIFAGVVRSDMNKTELMNPVRLQALLDDALLYEQQLIGKKEKLRQRADRLSAMLTKPQ